MAEGIPNFPHFDPYSDPDTVGQRWEKWMERFNTYLEAFEVKEERKSALLLFSAGEEVQDIAGTLDNTPKKKGDKVETRYEALSRALNGRLNPQVNVDYEIYIFRQMQQKPEETLDMFYTRLERQAKYCGFHSRSAEVRAQIIQSCKSKKLRKSVLESPEMSLEDILRKGRAQERSETQAKVMETKSGEPVTQTVNAIKSKRAHTERRNNNASKTCKFCGNDYHNTLTDCPARGKKCNKCLKLNHFAKCCLTKEQKQQQSEKPGRHAARTLNVEDDSDDESEEELRVLWVHQHVSRKPEFSVNINGHPVIAIADTGASANIVDKATYSNVGSPALQATATKIFGFDSDKPLSILGTFRAPTIFERRKLLAKFYVLDGNAGNLIRCKTAEALGMVKLAKSVSGANPESLTKERLIQKYPNIFGGIGRLKNFSVKLHIDKEVKPVALPHRRVPFHLRQKVEEELDQLEKADIIERVEGPTPWVSPIVVAPKPHDPSKVRICVDMKAPNAAIKRERHITPTLDDIVADLTGSTVFSKLDLAHGYHQLDLDKESRFITTFSTHKGLFRYKRLFFGVNAAAEIFQKTIQDSLNGLSGVLNVSDDILVHGETQAEHDGRLHAVLKRLNKLNLTVNWGKCKFSQPEVTFFGFVFSGSGLRADPKKVDAIKELQPPKNQAEVRSLLGMTNYVARFIPQYSTVTAPLRLLLKKDATFTWTTEHQKALKMLKNALMEHPTLQYFNPALESTLIVDASPVGLGAILTQQDGTAEKIVAYGSRSLTPTEAKYSQLEREALAIAWGCAHFRLYILGKPITVKTDHKPLVSIFNNASSHTNPRLERWLMKLQSFDVVVRHISGSTNPADYLSRHPNAEASKQEHYATEHFVSALIQLNAPRAIPLEEIQQATQEDEELQEVLRNLKTGKWNQRTEDLATYWKCRTELTSTEDGKILLKAGKICIPAKLQRRLIEIAHEAHLGMVKTKQILRDKVWFPKLGKMVERTVENCIPCQLCIDKTQRQPVIPSPMPDTPWEQVSADFYSLPNGEKLLVVIDTLSRFPEVIHMGTTTAAATIKALRDIFARYGIPNTLKSDNGPPFTSAEFKTFMDELNTHHRKVTPLWPAANGEVERFMRVINKTVRTAAAERKNWKEQLPALLLAYRTTPHSTTGVPPATLMFGRNIKNKVPELPVNENNELVAKAKANDKEAKKKMKRNADRHNRAKPTTFKPGEKILLKKDSKLRNKAEPLFEKEDYTVTNVKGSMITATNKKGNVVTRNISYFQPLRIDNHSPEEGKPSASNCKQESSPKSERQKTPPKADRPKESPKRDKEGEKAVDEQPVQEKSSSPKSKSPPKTTKPEEEEREKAQQVEAPQAREPSQRKKKMPNKFSDHVLFSLSKPC